MGKAVDKGGRKASATVKATRRGKSVSAVSRGGSGVAAGRNARVDRATRETAVAAGQDADVRFSPAIPAEIASQLKNHLRELRAHAEAIESPEDREEARSMVVRVQEQL